MKIKRLTEDILTIEDFITEEESRLVINVLEEQAENGSITWTPISFYESYSAVLPQDGDPELEKYGLKHNFFSDLENRFKEAVASIHGKDVESISKIGYHTQKWEPGAYARPHSDNTNIDGGPSPFERSRYAAFLYLNEDFDGGILKFVKQRIELKPKAGLLAAFAGGFDNIHEVTLIKKGTRYTIGSFWDDRKEEDYPEELRNKWAEEMKEIRSNQEKEKAEWIEVIKEGYRISESGEKYKVEELGK